MSNRKLLISEKFLKTLHIIKINYKKIEDIGIFIVMLTIGLFFECLGWYINHKSFLFNIDRIIFIILQISIIGIISIGVTQVIITTGIDLSSGSVTALTAVIAASLAQTNNSPFPIFPYLLNLPLIIPIFAGLFIGLLCGFINGIIIVYTKIPPFIATLGMMLFSRGIAEYYTKGENISFLSKDFIFIGQGSIPAIIFIILVIFFHLILKHTKYGKFLYIIGKKIVSENISGIKKHKLDINTNKYLIIVYSIAGLLSGLAGILLAAKLDSGRSNFGISYELDAITVSVIGGSNLMGGSGRITGMFLGAIIIGIIKSGFVFIGIDVNFQNMIKGIIIIIAASMNIYLNKNISLK